MTARKFGGMTQEHARAFALSLPEATEQSHMGRPDFRVRNKIFLTLPPDVAIVNLKSSSTNLAALVASDPETYRDVWGGRWVSVILARVEAQLLRSLIVDAWCRAAPHALSRKLACRLGA